jgi:hypothetical protein
VLALCTEALGINVYIYIESLAPWKRVCASSPEVDSNVDNQCIATPVIWTLTLKEPEISGWRMTELTVLGFGKSKSSLVSKPS